VIFLQQSEYVIGAPLDLSDLSHVDVDIQGGITFTNNTDFWQENAFKFDFQDARSFFLLGGEDVNVYGGGVLEGNGQPWWDLFYTNKTVKRPILFATVGLHGGSISDLSLNNSPFWTNVVANSSDVVFTDIKIRAISHTFSFEKNTDGWDIIQSDNIVIQNSTVTNGDGESPSSRLTNNTDPHRLRLLQAKRHQHSCPKSVLQRHTRHLGRIPWTVSRTYRYRREHSRP
jgi:galacturan 1,4-alpha-galacturonidase